jgi:PII-like signaling protein
MKIEGEARQLSVFINSTDQWHGKPLYAAIVQRCQQKGIAGATVSRCAEGYGAHRELHTSRLLELSQDMPVRIDIVDLAERIDPFLPELGEMIHEGLITVANVRFLRFLPDPEK